MDDTLEQRRANRVEKLIQQARFPIPHATIAELDYRDGRETTPTRMRRYATHDWRQDPLNLLISSPTGGGKTYLACAIGISACESEHEVQYYRMDDLARELTIARNDIIIHQDYLNRLSRIDLLIIDDFLTVGIDQNAASDLFTILANREHRLPTIVAGQSGPEYWAQILPDRVAADSIVNRLANKARRITLGNLDMRRATNQETRKAPEYWE